MKYVFFCEMLRIAQNHHNILLFLEKSLGSMANGLFFGDVGLGAGDLGAKFGDVIRQFLYRQPVKDTRLKALWFPGLVI